MPTMYILTVYLHECFLQHIYFSKLGLFVTNVFPFPRPLFLNSAVNMSDLPGLGLREVWFPSLTEGHCSYKT